VRFVTTALDGVWMIELDRLEDERGSFARTFCESEFAGNGLPTRFPQCNLSTNRSAGTLRGMHFNVAPYEEGKLVRCVRGAVYDVVVDMRRGSETSWSWCGIELSAENGRALYVPPGFAHGFMTLLDGSDVYYHMTESYRPDASRGFRWDDPAVGIEWPSVPTVVSDRDQSYAPIDRSSIGT
jgi:dTDP-4-dehydrorhamnose 3,5-epimerase